MAGNRSGVLRAVTRTLEEHEPLRALLKHTKGANTLQGGARIIGDSVRIDDLPLPCIVISIGGGSGIDPRREVGTWILHLTIYGVDVFQVADVLDQLEGLAVRWTQNGAVTEPLNRFRVESHESLDAVGPAGRLIAVRVNLEVSWISN